MKHLQENGLTENNSGKNFYRLGRKEKYKIIGVLKDFNYAGVDKSVANCLFQL
jgi:hypothetical protein